MIKLFDEYYYIDFEAIETAVNLEIVQSGNTVEQQIKFVKYDVVKMMLETILTEREDVDEEIGMTARTHLESSLLTSSLWPRWDLLEAAATRSLHACCDISTL
jgi:hypothetical protein